jgi:hypothetical protein
MRHGTPPQERIQVRWTAASSSGSGRRPSRPGHRRRRRGHPWSAGLSAADPGRVGCGRRPRLTLAFWAGQAGVPRARDRRRRCGHGRRPQREVAAPATRRPSQAGWATTVRGGRGACRPYGRAWRGAMGLPAGMGVRPQGGPGWQRAFPACCRQRSELRRWLVGLPGLEPGTSSLSAITRSPPCRPACSQVAADRQGQSNALSCLVGSRPVLVRV